ncbi:MAG: hypothetical protein IJ598_02160 [Ruminococcus sp.]|nr:hypothetical protein [Ruminococcus sp.]
MEKVDKQTLTEICSELYKGFSQSIILGCRKVIEVSAKYVLKDTPENEMFKKGAAERLERLMGYCIAQEQPISSTILVRILRESETDKEIMNALQYDYSVEYERSVNEVVYACLNFFCVIGEAVSEQEVM